MVDLVRYRACSGFDRALILTDRLTVPDSRAANHWKKRYSSLLPANYTQFEAHWQSQDIGAQIFSFRRPDKMTGADGRSRYLVAQLPGFKVCDVRPNEIAVSVL